jgi:prepilin peptidase CpaA
MVNSVLCKGLEGATGSALGILAGTGLLVPFFLLGGIGAGDVKLAAAAGAIKGWEFAIGGIFAGSVLAAVFCLSVAVANGTAAGVLRRTRDFLRYLIVFRAIVPIDTAESKKIPYGFFLCLGFFAVATGAARFF